MALPTLDEVQRLAEQLEPIDQARLVGYLAPRIARALASTQTEAATPSDSASSTPSEAWQRFLRIGDEIARSTPPGAPTMTAEICGSRR